MHNIVHFQFSFIGFYLILFFHQEIKMHQTNLEKIISLFSQYWQNLLPSLRKLYNKPRVHISMQ